MLPLPSHTRLRDLYHRSRLSNTRTERLFISFSSFLVAWGAARLQTHRVRGGRGRNLVVKDLHIHHATVGIFMLIGAGYAWLHIGGGCDTNRRWHARATTAVYGVGCALTMDEIANWLKLEDLYWVRSWRKGIDATILITALVCMGVWASPFLRAVLRDMTLASSGGAPEAEVTSATAAPCHDEHGDDG